VRTIKKSRSSFTRLSIVAIALVALLTAILIFLAILQYRWSGEISEAEHERMHASLRSSMDQFRFQFNSELRQLGFAFQPDTTILALENWSAFAATCDGILGVSDFHLVRNVYLWIAESGGNTQLLKLNRQARQFESSAWPADFEPIRARYARFFSEPPRGERGIRPFNWTITPQIPLMVQPLIRFQPTPNNSGSNAQFIGHIMLQLNMETMCQSLFPELARRYFNGPDGFVYQVAVVRGRDPAEILYRSDSHLTLASFAIPDDSVRLLNEPPDLFRPNGPMPDRAGPPGPMPPFRMEPPGPNRMPGFMPMAEPNGAGLELVAKHRKGSLEAAVTESRRRNLALSFGILLLLAGSMAMIIVFTRRAQRLAQLQIDFVAGVSHELRTPLAVICSAGDNLADGIIAASGGSARKYGELIRNEGRKLTAMVEQIMAFASVRREKRQYALHPAHINEIAAASLREMETAITAAGFSVERTFDRDLPMVLVDTAALSQAVQNLIQNALKYSGESRWLAIRTEKALTRRGAEVRLTVEDKGMGIDSEDLRHIFEPFYRGRAAASEQIHGTGLGLFMVREAVASMGGTVSVRSARGKGTALTIHLPGLPQSAGRSTSNDGEGEAEHAV
jgi:signal transduction histidine kinase